jgi:hypothetical protein
MFILKKFKMKKVVLFFMLGVFSLSMSSFKIEEVDPIQCDHRALAIYHLIMAVTGDENQANKAYNERYFDCISEGGSSEMEMTLE